MITATPPGGSPATPRAEEADDSMVLAFFDMALSSQKDLPAGERASCVAIADNPGHHDPEAHIFKVLRKRYPGVRLASRCGKSDAILSVGPFWRDGRRILGAAGVESMVGRCTFEAVPLAPGLWRLIGQPCLQE